MGIFFINLVIIRYVGITDTTYAIASSYCIPTSPQKYAATKRIGIKNNPLRTDDRKLAEAFLPVV